MLVFLDERRGRKPPVHGKDGLAAISPCTSGLSDTGTAPEAELLQSGKAPEEEVLHIGETPEPEARSVGSGPTSPILLSPDSEVPVLPAPPSEQPPPVDQPPPVADQPPPVNQPPPVADQPLPVDQPPPVADQPSSASPARKTPRKRKHVEGLTDQLSCYYQPRSSARERKAPNKF